MRYTAWCHISPTLNNGQQPPACPEASNVGFRSYADQTDWLIQYEMFYGFVSGTVSAWGPETTSDQGSWQQPTLKERPIQITMATAQGYPADRYWTVRAVRSPVCEAGYTPVGSKTDLCKKAAPLVSSKNLGCCTGTPSVLAGNPINTAVGNKLQIETDYLGEGDFPLSFSRAYNSLYGPAIGNLGAYWLSNYDRAVFSGSSSALATAYRPDGKTYAFTFSGNQGVPDADVTDRLVRLTDGAGALTGWRYTTSRDEVELYDAPGKLQSITNRAGFTQTLFYSDANTPVTVAPDAGLLIRVVDDKGRKLEFSYDSYGRIVSLTDAGGGVVSYAYDSIGRLTTRTDQNNIARTYLYNESAFTQGVNLYYALTGIIDESQNRFATFSYDTTGRALSTEHAGGVGKVVVSFNAQNNSANVTDALGITRNYAFTTQYGVSKLATITEPCSTCGGGTNTQTTSYDSNGFIDTSVDRNGVSADDNHNSRGLPAQRIEAANDTTGRKRTIQTDWHTDFRVPTERRIYNAANTLVAKSVWTYNTRGQALTASQIDPVTSTARTTTTAYCEQADVTAGTCPLVGLVKSVNGPRTDLADTTTFTYYASDDASCSTAPMTCPHRKGDVWKVANALGQITETLAYDGAGRALSVKDADGVVTDLEYHPRGWLTARKTRGTNNAAETDDAITRIEYWPTGLVKKVIQPDGAFTAYTYDAAHRLTDIADNAGNTIHYTLDNAGNRAQENTKDPQGGLKRALSRVHNQLGQLQTQADVQANPTDFTYDANGNTDTVTDALGRVTDNNYDPLNRLSRTLQDVGGINAETQFAYDALDNLTQVTDPKGLNTGYTYNGLGDLTQLVSPDTGTTTYTYDSAGNRATQIDARNQPATYSYDALDRLIGITYAGASLDVAYTYDATQVVCDSGETFSQGRLTRIADSSGATQYCFDRFGNLVRKVQTTNGQSFALRYAYTLAGQLQSVTYPDGAIADYVRDAQGRVTEVGVTRTGSTREVLLNQASYHPFGPVAGWSYGNGRQLLRPVDQDYQPLAVEDAGAGGLSLGFGFDAVGNLTELTPANNPAPLASFGYDALSRLTEFRDGPTQVAIETYTYDATGNRQSLTNSTGTEAYTYWVGNHRLSQVGAVVRSYDAMGNTTAIGGTAKEFVYDATGRMSQVKQGGVATMNYAYNGKGEQIRRYLGTANTYTVYDEAGHWLGEYDNSGAALQQTIWLDDLPVGLIANGSLLHYIEPDHLGTPRVVIEVARNVPVWTWDLKGEAFGSSAPNQDPDGDANPFVFNLRFPGQRYDAASGLNQNYFREYESGTGRYSQSDPIGHAGGIATYAYAGSSPLRFSDALGLEDVWDTKTCAGALGLTTCDGKDGFIANNCNVGCDRTCTQMHEQDHVRIIKSRFPNACVGRPLGAAPYPINWTADTPEYRALIHELECRADTITANCIRKLKRQGKSDGPAEKHLLEAIKRRKDRKCDLYGY